MSVLDDLCQSVITGNAAKAEEFTQTALTSGVTPVEVLNKGLIAGMNVVGEKFKKNEYYVPEVLIAARAMKTGMKILRPKLTETGIQPEGRLVIGTIKGDLHDIGKNLVAMMMEGAGYEVIDLGVDVTPEKYIAAIKEHKAQVIGMSALLTTTMMNMKETIERLKSVGIRDEVKVIVGGAPLTQNFAEEIGADGYSPDAASAVDLVKKLIKS